MRPKSSAATRSKILEIAEVEFATCGHAGAHLQAIAEQVGVQKTALYYYFPSKAALYNAVLQSMLESLRDTVVAALAKPGSGEERLEHLLSALNDLLAERPNYAKMLFRMFVDQSPFDYAAAAPTVNEVIMPILQFYREGADRGEFRHLSSRHFFMSLVGTIFFHYASRDFASGVLGVDDIYTSSVVSWRKAEIFKLFRHGVLLEPDGAAEGSGER